MRLWALKLSVIIKLSELFIFYECDKSSTNNHNET